MSESGARVLLFDSDKGLGSSDFITGGENSNNANDAVFGREDSFRWDTIPLGLVKLIHVTLREQGESYVTNNEESACFRFPDAAFSAKQRKTSLRMPIALSDALLASEFGFSRAAGISEIGMNTRLDTKPTDS